MALTSTPTDYANLCTGRLAAKISPTTATGFIVTADTFKTPAGTSAATWPTGPQIWKISRKTRTTSEVEFVGVETASQTGSTVTTGTVNRYLPANGSSLTSQGDGLTFPAGSVVELVWHAFAAEKVAYQDIANTFSANQTISSTNELRFNSSATAVWKDGSGNLSFKDAANGTKTLTTLAAAAGADEKAKVSSNDTTQGYLNGKLVAGAGITLTENSDGSNETLSVIATNTVATGHTGLSTITSGALMVGNGTGNVTLIGPGSSGQVPVSNGTTIAMGTAGATIKSAGTSTNVAYTTDQFSNSNAENAFATTLSPGANALVAAGDKLVVEAFGTAAHNSGPVTITFKLKWGTAVVGQLGAAITAQNSNTAGKTWYMKTIITADTVGASGVLQTKTEFFSDIANAAGTYTTYYYFLIDGDGADTSVTGFNTTTSQALSITTQWSAASSSSRCSLNHFSCYRLLNSAA